LLRRNNSYAKVVTVERAMHGQNQPRNSLDLAEYLIAFRTNYLHRFTSLDLSCVNAPS